MRCVQATSATALLVLSGTLLAASAFFPGSAQAAPTAICGDLDGSGKIAATDALFLLKRAVGQPVTISCPACAALVSGAESSPYSGALAQSLLCGDLDGSGKIAATDALFLLKRAVGQSVAISCPVCAATGCGNGIVDGSEECERLEGCADGDRCTAQCTCEPAPASPPSSQGLIEDAFARGDIDYPTSLLYRVWALFQAPELPEAYDGAGSEGEDTALFLELSHARNSLPADIETAIAPYLVRPNDEASIYSQDPGTAAALATASDPAPPPIGCPPDAVGQPDWRSFASAGNHFVVWSCGGGVGGADPHASRRAVAAALAEAIWTRFDANFAVPAPDDYDAGPAPQHRIDIYILDPNQCRIRGGGCVPVPGNALAAAAPASPCSRDSGGPLTSSAYIVVSAAQVSTTAPGPDSASKFRYILTHEMFHAATFGLNLQAQGGICPGGTPDLVPKELRSWLTEASAEWSSFAYYEEDDPERRTILFEKFQKERDLAIEGLQNVSREVLPYEAFLYPAFVQEESGQDPQPMLDFWLTSQPARNRDDLDTLLDRTLPFADHFRDFAVRNLNRDPPGDPIFPPHSAYDPALPLGTSPFIPEPSIELRAPMDLLLPIAIAPLSAQYEHYYVNDEVRSARVDLSDVPNSEHVRLDAIVKVGATWERRKVEGPLFEFCREDEGDDISEIYLVFSNDDRRRDGKVDGNYKLETRLLCPGGWSGHIRTVFTLDESSRETQPAGTTVYERHEREEQRWTVVETNLVTTPYQPEFEELKMAWQAISSVDIWQSYTAGCIGYYPPRTGVETDTEVANSGFSETSLFAAFPASAGTFSLQPLAVGHSFDMPVTYTNDDQCEGTFQTSQGTKLVNDGIAFLYSVPEFTWLVPLPNDPGHFAGSATVLHDEQPRPGGAQVLDLSVEWDLRRTLDR